MGRSDGIKVKGADPMYTVVPYIMNKRYDAMNMIKLDIPVEPIKNYIKEQRAQGISMSHLGVLIAAYLRTMVHYPILNRFISNKRIYDRKSIDCAMVVLKESDGDGEGTISKISLDKNDNIHQVQQKIIDFIQRNKEASHKNSTDKVIKKLLAVPGLVNIGVGLFKIMDKFNLLPKAIIKASPFHTSFTISNLASIRTNYIYHHIYEFGTTSVFIAMGNMHEVPFREKGEIVFKTCLPLGVVMDERICSGHYFAKAFQCMKNYLSNPALLEKTYEQELEEQKNLGLQSTIE